MRSWWPAWRKKDSALSPEDKTRFLIICAARTGSTMLRHMLNSHPDICSHGEVFQPHLIFGLVGVDHKGKAPVLVKLQNMRDKAPVQFLREYVFYAGPCRAVGAKILYQTVEHEMWRSLKRAILTDRDIRIIHLFRRNRLKRYVSDLLSRSAEHPGVIFDPRDRPLQRHLVISPSDCLADIRAIEKQEERFRGLFQRHQCHEVMYEEVLADQERVLSDLQRFLSIEPQSLDTKTYKVNSDALSDIIENYAELAEQLRDAGYGRFLDEGT